mgnify:CR=1 FL=1
MTISALLADQLRGKQLLIFDFDGTVADTSPLHARAFAEVLSPLGVAVEYERIAGLSTADAMRQCLAVAGLILEEETLARLVADKQSVVRDMIRQGLQPLPGMDDLLRWARPRYRLAMVTSGSRGTVNLSLAALGYEGWFDPLLCAEDVAVAKPSPEGFLQACALAGCEADEALVFEDSSAGLQAAEAAGLQCVDVSKSLHLNSVDGD